MRFRTPVCQMNENREISDKSQHNFHFLPHKLLKNYWTEFHEIFTQYRSIICAVNALIEVAVSHSVSE